MHIRQSIDNGLFTAPEKPEKLFSEKPEKNSQNNGFKDENNKTVIHDPIGFCMFILSHVDGSSWGTSLTDQCGKCRNEINNRETKTDTG